MNPVLVTLYGMQIRYFGILVAVGLLILFFMVRANLKQAKIRLTQEELLDWIILIFVYGIIGARLTYVLFHLDYYLNPHADWYEPLAFWKGGLDLNGGIIAAAFTLWVLNSSKKPRLESVTDQVVPPLFIALALARIGSFINGESFGYPTEHGIGVIFRHGPASTLYEEVPLHPIMLYESFLCLIGFLILNLLRKGNYRDGFTTGCALFWYSCIRLIIGLFSSQDLALSGRDESLIIGYSGVLISAALVFGRKLYRKLPSPDEQFPSTRKWNV